MAFAVVAVERMADAFGMPRSAVGRAVRALREHDTALWPEGQAGRGNGAHVNAEHLANALLAVAVPTREPLNEAPSWVLRYGAFVPIAQHHASSTMSEDAEGTTTNTTLHTLRPWEGMEWGVTGTLHGMLSGLIYYCAQPGMLEHLRKCAVRMVITTGPRPMCSISTTSPIGGAITTDDYAEPTQGELLPRAEAGAALVRQVHVPFGAFEVLGALCADTEARRKAVATPTPSLPLSETAPTTAGPETENAGPTTGPAPIRDHDRNSSDPVFLAEQPKASGGERQSQAPSRGPGRSLNRHRSRHNGRHDSADRACA